MAKSKKSNNKRFKAEITVEIPDLGVEKLKSTIGRFFDDNSKDLIHHFMGPDRLRRIGRVRAELEKEKADARAYVKQSEANAAIEIQMRKSFAEVYGERMKDWKSQNVQSIVDAAMSEIQRIDQPISEKPVSDDFLYNFFNEFDVIGDKEVHAIIGRLLAGEVTNPGTFSKRTIRVLRDLEPSDFSAFGTLCRFSMDIDGPTALVLDCNDSIYREQGLNFRTLVNLDSLGLITMANSPQYFKWGFPAEFELRYEATKFLIRMKKGSDRLHTGQVLLTEPGMKLAPLMPPEPVSGFLSYIFQKWQKDGHVCERLS